MPLPGPGQFSFQRMLDLLRQVFVAFNIFVQELQTHPDPLPSIETTFEGVELLAGHFEKNGFGPEGQLLRKANSDFFSRYIQVRMLEDVDGRPADERKALLEQFAALRIPALGSLPGQKMVLKLQAQRVLAITEGVVRTLDRTHRSVKRLAPREQLPLRAIKAGDDEPSFLAGLPYGLVRDGVEKLHQVDRPAGEGAWLVPPLSLADMANRLDNIGTRKAKSILAPFGLKNAGNRQLWTVQLDRMPAEMAQKLRAK